MTTNDSPPQLVLQQLIQGFQVTQCIYVAAKLGIADLLKDGPQSLEDLPHVVAEAPPLLEAAGVSGRCEVVGGDAFTAVPADYETYLLSRVILTDRTAELLVLELDVQMLVSTGGKERTDAEYRALLGAADFELTRLIPVLTPFYLIEAVRL